ncbi:MAG TPA: hypothetical protein VME92_08330 [Acetobacteraceae bacterium]|nr:hypothetical protein [Acetobacteraceae bacterium]
MPAVTLRPTRLALSLVLVLALAGGTGAVAAARKFFAYNETTATDFTGVYMAPAGTTRWGPNQALNDPDKSLDMTERLVITGIRPGHYDVRLVDRKGRACVMKGVDLTHERSFEIRDQDLTGCS